MEQPKNFRVACGWCINVCVCWVTHNRGDTSITKINIFKGKGERYE